MADDWVQIFKKADKNSNRVRIGDLKKGVPYFIKTISSKQTTYGEVVNSILYAKV
jgi:hypothetical protein